jgi:putative spermidine/putrescine transport system ATP-binding protein
MVMEPKVLLLDEPLSNLDARLRLEMRAELQRVQKETGVTMIFVTHDQAEALALADRIVVMLNGTIEQIGAPEEIYNRPNSAFVADFVGFENVFRVRAGELDTETGRFALGGAIPREAQGLAWRPSMVELGGGPFEGSVRGMSFAGGTRQYLLDTPLGPIKVEASAHLPTHALGAAVRFDLPVSIAAPLQRFG